MASDKVLFKCFTAQKIFSPFIEGQIRDSDRSRKLGEILKKKKYNLHEKSQERLYDDISSTVEYINANP